jgi:hypothetical protein
MSINFFTKCDIENDISSINKILSTGIFSSKNSSHPLVKSAFIELLICLRDLMYKTEKYSTRISFTDDVVKTDTIKDVTDLIKYVRDALCHPDSPNHYLVKNNIKATFNIAYGKGCIISTPDINITSDYEDDVCFFFGEHKIYLTRHIIRAFNESKEKLLPLIQSNY